MVHGKAMGMNRGSTMVLVDNLEAAGFVRRDPGPDRRTHALHLTAEGQATMENALRVNEEILSTLLGGVQAAAPVIHLTGTNGKTSTARMVERLLGELGLRTGRFTSPHLSSVRERIAIDGEPIAASRFVRFMIIIRVSSLIRVSSSNLLEASPSSTAGTTRPTAAGEPYAISRRLEFNHPTKVCSSHATGGLTRSRARVR